MPDLAHVLLQNALETRQEIGRLVGTAEAGRGEAETGGAAINQRIDDFRGVVTKRLDKLEGKHAKGKFTWLLQAQVVLRLAAFVGTIATGVFLHLTAAEWKLVLFKIPPG